MRSDAVATVDGLYAAWAIQDVETVLAYCSDDICYNVLHPISAFSAEASIRGRSAVRSYLEGVAATWEFLEIVPGTMLINGCEVREYGRFKSRHRTTGEVLETFKRHIWIVKNGRVVSCTEYQDLAHDLAFMRMAWSRAARPPTRVVNPA